MEGALGKIILHSVRNPRQLLQVIPGSKLEKPVTSDVDFKASDVKDNSDNISNDEKLQKVSISLKFLKEKVIFLLL